MVGMPKSGTSSIHDFFRCGGVKSVTHQTCGNVSCARCIWDNVARKRDVLDGCRYTVYTQLDYERYGNTFCFFPQQNLSLLHESYPSSTFILNTRNPIGWVNSVSNWGALRARLGQCHLGPYDLSHDDEMIAFYNAHSRYVREFARATGHRLVEVDIERNVTALVEATGIHESCFRDANSQTRRLRRRTCFVGDSLVRQMWCWHETRGIECHNWHEDRNGSVSKFFWRPTVEQILTGAYHGCDTIVWNNLFHEVRRDPAAFTRQGARARALQDVYAKLSSVAKRVVYYSPQRPTGNFSREVHEKVTMLDAWNIDRAVAHGRTDWLSVDADAIEGKKNDGRHYDSRGVGRVYAQLAPMLASR